MSWGGGGQAWGGAPSEEEGHGLLDPAEQSDDGMLDELQDELDAAMRAANAALDDCDDSLDAAAYRSRLCVAGQLPVLVPAILRRRSPSRPNTGRAAVTAAARPDCSGWAPL